MRVSVPSRIASGVAASIGVVSLALGATPSTAKDPGPYRVSATCKITFNSFEIGTLRCDSSVGLSGYVVESEVELSALFGAVSWKGATRGSDTIDGVRPKPVNYTFNFQGSTGAGAVQMGFNEAAVSSLNPARKVGIFDVQQPFDLELYYRRQCAAP